eukprot:scaffold79005_cov46-Phaeocystis_antarctica.AAC.2
MAPPPSCWHASRSQVAVTAAVRVRVRPDTKGKEQTRLLPPRGACGAIELRCFSDERALLLRLYS